MYPLQLPIGGSIGSGWLAWSKGWRPPGAACYIRQMNRVNSRSGSTLLRWQHHTHCRITITIITA